MAWCMHPDPLSTHPPQVFPPQCQWLHRQEPALAMHPLSQVAGMLNFFSHPLCMIRQGMLSYIYVFANHSDKFSAVNLYLKH
jgi:hypothetical protein